MADEPNQPTERELSETELDGVAGGTSGGKSTWSRPNGGKPMTTPKGNKPTLSLPQPVICYGPIQ